MALVGLAPSQNRPLVRLNEPFGARSYNLVARIINNLGGEGEVYITNFIKSPQPARKKVKIALLREAYPNLIRELQLVEPARIIAFGAQVAKFLCPGFSSLTDDHGTLFWNPELKCCVVPTFHPSAIGDDPNRLDFLINDLRRADSLPDPELPNYEILRTPAELERVMRLVSLYSTVFIDVETTGTDILNDTVTMIGFTWDFHDKVYILDTSELEFSQLKRIIILLYDRLSATMGALVAHNAVFDLGMLSRHSGFIWNMKVKDTMVLAFLLGYEVLALKHLTSVLTKRPGSRAFGGFESAGYLAEDVLSTREIYWELDPKTSKIFSRTLYEQLLVPIVRMTLSGTRIDRDHLLEILPIYQKLHDKAQTALNEKLGGEGVNWNSPQQVSRCLLSHGVNLTETTDTGNLSVAEKILLQHVGHPLVDALLEYREATKFLEFLVDWEKRTQIKPYLHPKMKMLGARTGRTSCVDPNMQNVPRVGPSKQVFISRFLNGHIGLIDLSQAELRIAGILSGDEAFCEMLLQDDPHKHIAAVVYKMPVEEISGIQRKKSKAVTFGLLYGGSVEGMAKRSGFDVREVEMVKDQLFESFPDLRRYIRRKRKQGIEKQFVTTAMGKIRDLRAIKAMNGENDVGRKAINTPIQGSASEVMLWIMGTTGTYLMKHPLKSLLLFGVHDSTLSDIHPNEEDQMAQVFADSFYSLNDTPLIEYPMFSYVPMAGDLLLGPNWASVESTNEAYGSVELIRYQMDSKTGLISKELVPPKALDVKEEPIPLEKILGPEKELRMLEDEELLESDDW